MIDSSLVQRRRMGNNTVSVAFFLSSFVTATPTRTLVRKVFNPLQISWYFTP
jgi:hypothetical protein